MGTQVFYHCPCPDGIFGALSAYLHLRQSPGEQRTRFVGHTVYASEAETQSHLDSLHPEDTLYMIDYCGKQGFLVDAARRVKRVVLLDHHKTAAEILDELRATSAWPANLEVVIDMDRSGATISWDYFSALTPNLVTDQEARAALVEKLKLVEDNDLWRHALADSKPFNVGLGALKLEYDFLKNPQIFETLLALKTSEVVESGKSLTEARNVKIAELIQTKFVIAISDGSTIHTGFAVTTDEPEIRSELGNQLAVLSKEAGHSPMGVVTYKAEGVADKTKVSLRAVDGFDSTVISKHYGGGGHKGASSFMVQTTDYEKMLTSAK